MSDQPDEILTIDEVASYLNEGKCIVYRLAASGKLLAFKLGDTWRFRRGELDQWIAPATSARQQWMTTRVWNESQRTALRSKANPQQLESILATDSPDSGKTFSLVERII